MTAPTLNRTTRREATDAELTQGSRVFPAPVHPSEHVRGVYVGKSMLSATRERDVSIEAAVSNGVAFLDERLGRDEWLRRVDVNTLDVVAQRNCVLAHVTSKTYVEALDALDIPFTGSLARTKWTDKHGFSRDLADGYEPATTRYGRLTAAWKTKIEQLRAEVTA